MSVGASRSNEELRLVAVNGCLGYGFDADSLAAGVEAGPDVIGADAGSTDPGPYYLGSGQSLVRPAQIRRDLGLALTKARAAKVPLIVGSAGMGGGEPNLQIFKRILLEIAHAEGLHFKLATIHSEIDKERVISALRSGGITPMADVPELSERDVRDSERIVGQMGTEPFAKALDAGADVVLTGRSCDTAIYAALPIARGFDPGLALHLAKIMECGAQCAIPLAPNDSLLGTIRRDHFLVRPLSRQRVCTPDSVAAHTMYEQGNPHILYEPEGEVDLTGADFEQVDAQTVRAAVRRNLGSVAESDYRLGFRYYGRDAVLGALEPERARVPHEVGALVEAIGRSQEIADHVLSLARSSLLHCPFPGRKTTAGNLAFPASPSDTSAGAVYEFSVYHLMDVDDPCELFPMELETV